MVSRGGPVHNVVDWMIFGMVTALLEPERQQKDWDEKLPFAMLAYRSAVQESTGESPAMMMLGREVQVPVHVLIDRPSPIKGWKIL